MKRHIVPLGMLISLVLALGVSAGIASKGNRGGTTAPLYEEIQQTLYRITERDINPQGPEVGLDGLIDQEMEKEWKLYRDSLVGKQIEGWRGWYTAYTEIEPEVSYNVAILMEEPGPKRNIYARVTLREVPADQLPKLKSWKEGQPVVFSGKIMIAWWDGQVWLEYSKIEPAE